jgi:nucleotide-binding universal stress UspA family protein
MFKQILVPLDGSTRAEQALPLAARLARASSGTVTLVQAVSPSSEFMEVVGEIVLPEVLDENVPAAKEYLEGVAQTSSLEGIRTATQVMIGHPAREIIEAAQRDNADLVVLCSHGYTGYMRWSMGSIAEKVACHAPSPVLILHEGSTLSTESGPGPHGALRVLVPLDGSEYAETALLPAALLACAFSAPARGELHLTRVVSPPSGEKSGSHDRAERARQYLRSLVERWQRHPLREVEDPLAVSMTWSVTEEDDVATGIIEAAESSGKREDAGRNVGCQVIAMATHGFSGPQLWALGSTTERVLQVARQPLLIVHQ